MATASSKRSSSAAETPARSTERDRRKAVAALEAELGHSFASTALLDEALTHGSAAGPVDRKNERLEFLGDRVLGLLTAHRLMELYPDDPEGDLAPRFNAMVRRETCAAIATRIGVGAALKLGKSEALSGGRKKEALLADAMEALMAAVYLDGGFDAAAAVHERLWGPEITAQANAPGEPMDPKTTLQEWAQARGSALPRYSVVERRGPDHRPSFVVAAALDDGRSAQGEGASKRIAERAAAAALLAAVRGADGDSR